MCYADACVPHVCACFEGDAQATAACLPAPRAAARAGHLPPLLTPPSTPTHPPQREGPAGFYKGLVPNVLRVMPQSALTFLVYETVMRALAEPQQA